MKKVALKEITNNLDSRRIPLNSTQRAEKETNPLYPYIGANNVMGYIDEYLFDEKILCVAEDGGSWGYQETCAKIYDEKVWVNNHAHVLTAKDDLVLEYLMYYLNYADLTLHINGATRGKLTKSSLNAINVPLPPLNQQKKIAAILDAADAYRQKTKALIAKYHELTQSLFLDMFGDPVTNPMGWEMKTLMELTAQITDGTHHTPTYTDSGVPFLRVTDVTGSNDSKKFISELEHQELIKRCHPVKGDILYTKNGTIGVGKIVDWDYDFSIFVSLCLLKPRHDLIQVKYLNHFLNTPFALRQAMKHSKVATIKNLHLVEIKKMNVPYPPVELQLEFVEKLEEIETQKSLAESGFQKAEDLFNSLLQKAFKGELTA